MMNVFALALSALLATSAGCGGLFLGSSDEDVKPVTHPEHAHTYVPDPVCTDAQLHHRDAIVGIAHVSGLSTAHDVSLATGTTYEGTVHTASSKALWEGGPTGAVFDIEVPELGTVTLTWPENDPQLFPPGTPVSLFQRHGWDVVRSHDFIAAVATVSGFVSRPVGPVPVDVESPTFEFEPQCFYDPGTNPCGHPWASAGSIQRVVATFRDHVVPIDVGTSTDLHGWQITSYGGVQAPGGSSEDCDMIVEAMFAGSVTAVQPLVHAMH